MLSDKVFSVLDVETTGLFPKNHDRIVEIGIVRINSNGDVLDEYESLINPQRDLGPTWLHGISAREAKRAPLFREIAGDILGLLKDTILIAHNARFDSNFIRCDFDRIGVNLPMLPSICTMRLAMLADPSVHCRKLGELCKHYGINVGRQHSAISDARSAAELFIKCLKKVDDRDRMIEEHFLSKDQSFRDEDNWPSLAVTKDPYPRSRAIIEINQEPSYIGQLVNRLPVDTDFQENQEYYDLLDRALEDRRITCDEQDALYSLAIELGLSRTKAIEAHKSYLKELVRLAKEDGIITDAENRDIDEVRHLLDLSDDDFFQILKDLDGGKASSEGILTPKVCCSEFIGKSVCFTGQLNCHLNGDSITRPIAKQLAVSKGMIIQRSVTKKLDFLVCSDPDSMSVKARKAKEYGTRILAESVFWRLLDIEVD